MFNGNSKSGIKYGLKALARSQSKYASIIAQHNLCIAYVGLGQMGLAAKYCAQAQTISMLDVYLKEIKPGLYKITRNKSRKAHAIILDAVVAQNLQINGLNEDQHRLAQVH